MNGFLRGLRLSCMVVVTGIAMMGPTQAEEGRTAFVRLFEWKWPDIAKECEAWLGPKGFAAVLISPPQEHPDIVTHTTSIHGGSAISRCPTSWKAEAAREPNSPT